MKILFLADGCHPSTQGGIQTFGRALKKMFDKELIFLSYYTRDKKLFEVNNVKEILSLNIIFRVIDKLLFRFPRNYISKKWIKKIKPDICILRSPQNLKVLEGTKCKKILVQHIRLDIYYKSKSYYNNNRELLEKSKKELDYFIVTSPKDKIKLIKEYNFPENKVKVIRHSCEIELKNDIKIKNKTLIMIARLDNNHKRFDLAIKAMKNLPDFKLKIYGSGPDRELLEKIIKDHNLKNVFLCGPTNEVKEKLDEAGIFVMTSDYEGYPITTIEAMRRGLPIIMRDTFEGASDIVINNGVLLNKKWEEKEFCEGVKNIYKFYNRYSENSIKLGSRHCLKLIKQNWEELFY